MKFIKLALIISAAAFFIIACNNQTTTNQSSNNAPAQPSPAASPKPTATPDEFAAARTTYSQVCSVCHGEQGEGGLKEIEKTKLKVPSLREGHVLSHNDEKLAQQISNGGDGMPPFKSRLKPEQINDLVRFIHHEFQGGANSQQQTKPMPNMKQ